MVEYAYSFFLTLPNLDFITAHFSLITAKMCNVTPLFQALDGCIPTGIYWLAEKCLCNPFF